MKVLVLEDDQPLARAMSRLLKALGHEAVFTTCVDEAQATLSADPERYEAVICDVNLTVGPSGSVFVAWARTHYPRIRRIVMSGCFNAALDAQANQGAGEKFLQKPFSRDLVAACLQ